MEEERTPWWLSAVVAEQDKKVAQTLAPEEQVYRLEVSWSTVVMVLVVVVGAVLMAYLTH